MSIELVTGILRGVGSLKESESELIEATLDPSLYVQIPSSIKILSEINLELQIQLVHEEFIISLLKLEVPIQGPCTTCGHSLMRTMIEPQDYWAFPISKARNGQLDISEILKDLLITLIPESLPCLETKCPQREDLKRVMEKATSEKNGKAFHPFQALLSLTKFNSKQE
jgi:hypothetical protein